MDKLQLINSNIIEISQNIDTTAKEITMLVHKLDSVNANGLDFIEEYTNKSISSLVNKPVVAKFWENKDDLGSHEQVVDSKTGKIVELNTIAIGTITDVWVDDFESDGKALFAKATIWSYKYPKITEIIERNFSEGICTSSVEVEIYKYNEGASQEYRYPIEYTYLSNCLLGQDISPADSDAGVIDFSNKEIAEAIMDDLKGIKTEEEGDVILSNKEKKEIFNKGNDIKFHIEVSELSHEDIRQEIYNVINPVNPTTEERSYKYWIREVFQSYFIVEEWNDSNKLFKVNYSLSGEKVTVDSEWSSVEITYQVVGTDIQGDLNKLQVELNNAKEELSNMDKTNEEHVVELQNSIKLLEEKVAELNETIVSQTEEKSKLEETVSELNSTIEELKPFKEKVETAEKEAKVNELSSRYEKLLSEEVFKSEDVQNAIQELNSQKLNEIVVDEVAKNSTKETEVSSKVDTDVVISSAKSTDLVQKSILQKYDIKS